MKTYSIGRSTEADIAIPDDTISRLHAELVITDDDQFYLTDCNSSNGSFVVRNDELVEVRQCFVNPDDEIVLGEYRTTALALANMAPDRQGESGGKAKGKESGEGIDKHLIHGPVRRDPLSGEIIRDEG